MTIIEEISFPHTTTNWRNPSITPPPPSYLSTSGGKGISNHHQKWLTQKGDQVTTISGSPGILDIVYKTKNQINQNSMPLYDSTNPITSLQKHLQPGTINRNLDQFIEIHQKYRSSYKNRIDEVQNPDAFENSE